MKIFQNSSIEHTLHSRPCKSKFQLDCQPTQKKSERQLFRPWSEHLLQLFCEDCNQIRLSCCPQDCRIPRQKMKCVLIYHYRSCFVSCCERPKHIIVSITGQSSVRGLYMSILKYTCKTCLVSINSRVRKLPRNWTRVPEKSILAGTRVTDNHMSFGKFEYVSAV